LFRDLRQLSRAKEYLEKSLFIKQTIGDEPGEAAGYDNLATVYSHLGEHKQAK